MKKLSLLALAPLVLVAACSSDASTTPTKTDAQYKSEVTTAMTKNIGASLTEFRQAVTELQNAAPTPSGRGWDKTQDAAAIASMKAAWTKARAAYELTEGAIAPIFPDLDAAVDERYDGFLADLAGKGDADLFDDVGVTGMHGVERILFSDVTPQSVVDFEKTLPGYKAAAFPATEQEAIEFKTKLCAKLVADVTKMEQQWQPAQIDLGGAFQGLIGLMNEQKEKVNKASDGTEESRYAQTTMLDLRKNLEGTKRAYLFFQAWVVSKTNAADPKHSGPNVDKAILDGFAKLEALYTAYPGDAIPQPPPTWSSANPSAADLETPFGKLWVGVHAAVDPTKDGSIVDEMNDSADLLGFPQFKAN
jgi:iron uptake system component EfeO